MRDWVASIQHAYHQVEVLSGTGDGGRDVAAFVTPRLFEGDWHNYQCKQYSSPVPKSSTLLEIGKTIYNVHLKKFSMPSEYKFVAPLGVSTTVLDLIYSPEKLRGELIDAWDSVCAKKIVKNKKIQLDSELLETLNQFPFDRVNRLSAAEILDAPHAKSVLMKWFDDPAADLPIEELTVPQEIAEHEKVYVDELLAAYSEHDSATYSSRADVPPDSPHAKHFAMQRELFYHTEFFKNFYEGSTPPGVLDRVKEEVFFGVTLVCEANYPARLLRANAVLQEAARISISGPLAGHASIPIRQGYCHHLANDRRLSWSS